MSIRKINYTVIAPEVEQEIKDKYTKQETNDLLNQYIQKGEVNNFTNYVHNQIASSIIWNINHNLDKYPSVSIVDRAGSVVIGDIKYIDKDNIQISFTSEFSGKAFLN